MSQCLLRSKNDMQIVNRSLEPRSSQIFTNYVYKYVLNLWVQSSAQPRNYNLKKFSGMISNAKRRMERYERYNLFNK
jgi:hypothetical protein